MRNEDILYKLADRLVLDFDSNFKCLLGNNRASNYFCEEEKKRLYLRLEFPVILKWEGGLKRVQNRPVI